MAKKAVAEDLALKQAAVDLGVATPEQFDEWVDAKKMLAPQELPSTASSDLWAPCVTASAPNSSSIFVQPVCKVVQCTSQIAKMMGDMHF